MGDIVNTFVLEQEEDGTFVVPLENIFNGPCIEEYRVWPGPEATEELYPNLEEGLSEDMGNMDLAIPDTENLTKYSAAHKTYHVKSGSEGRMTVELNLTEVPYVEDAKYLVRYMILREHHVFSKYPVDLVCSGHRLKDDSPGMEHHILRPLHDPSVLDTFFRRGIQHPSVIHQVLPPLKEDQTLPRPTEKGRIQTSHQFWFTCKDTCVNSTKAHEISSTMKQMKHQARDLRLVVTLEMKIENTMSIISRRSILIWPKAAIRDLELNKAERRKPQGGKAHQLKRQKVSEAEGDNNPTENGVMNQTWMFESATDYLAETILAAPAADQNEIMQGIFEEIQSKVNSYNGDT